MPYCVCEDQRGQSVGPSGSSGSSLANVCPVLLTACPSGHPCTVGEVSFALWDIIWLGGGSDCVPLVHSIGGREDGTSTFW